MVLELVRNADGRRDYRLLHAAAKQEEEQGIKMSGRDSLPRAGVGRMGKVGQNKRSSAVEKRGDED